MFTMANSLIDFSRLCALHAIVQSNVEHKESMVLMWNRLMKEASINAKQAGDRGISARHIKKVTEVSLKTVHFTTKRWLSKYRAGVFEQIQRMRQRSTNETNT